MTLEEFKDLTPFLDTLNKDQVKVVWYIEARKKGNPCITDKQKEEALKTPIINRKKIRLRHPIKIGNKLYTDTGSEWI